MKREYIGKDFVSIARQQRDLPEEAMVRAQLALGGGSLSHAIEHIGDLIHRMSEYPRRGGGAGYQYVKKKIMAVLPYMQDGNFSRAVREEGESNARYRNVSVDEYWKKAREKLVAYVAEHRKLYPLNDAQERANSAAMWLGNMHFEYAMWALQDLWRRLENPKMWERYALENMVEHRRWQRGPVTLKQGYKEAIFPGRVYGHFSLVRNSYFKNGKVWWVYYDRDYIGRLDGPLGTVKNNVQYWQDVADGEVDV